MKRSIPFLIIFMLSCTLPPVPETTSEPPPATPLFPSEESPTTSQQAELALAILPLNTDASLRITDIVLDNISLSTQQHTFPATGEYPVLITEQLLPAGTYNTLSFTITDITLKGATPFLPTPHITLQHPLTLTPTGTNILILSLNPSTTHHTLDDQLVYLPAITLRHSTKAQGTLLPQQQLNILSEDTLINQRFAMNLDGLMSTTDVLRPHTHLTLHNGKLLITEQPPEPSTNLSTPTMKKLKNIQLFYNSFEPTEVVIPVGSTVNWHNTVLREHQLAFSDGSHSGIIKGGVSYSRTFTTPGIYAFEGLDPTMKGKVIVQ